MSEQKKAVLMIHTDQEQGLLWQAVLSTQQLDVIWESTPLDLIEYLEECDRQKLPDLLIMDTAIKSPNSETLQSSSVCQWVSKQNARIKVVLFNPRQERIKDVEHSWAIRRGAADMLPRLSQENLIAEVARVTALIGCTMIYQPLEKIAKNLGSKLKEADLSKSSLDNAKTDVGEVVMYRGVRIRR